MKRNILLINACVREGSRTLRLARRVLAHLEGEATELDLEREALRPLTGETLAGRDALLRSGELEDPALRYARAFAAADEIVIAAPYWDLSFPAAVKTFFEQVTVTGVTFSYGEDGRPMGHCRAKRLFYVMTAGGPILPPNHGFAYVRDLASMFYGIPEAVLFSAELLDVEGVDAAGILAEAEARIEAYFG
ncbi:MAG: NAD(P)H-dependent oxidoreductase [Oscillospiraceae bacterium]|nr:NAD(P)H-dependent oxidoreductase [Oscillospiraceae bacterium]